MRNLKNNISNWIFCTFTLFCLSQLKFLNLYISIGNTILNLISILSLGDLNYLIYFENQLYLHFNDAHIIGYIPNSNSEIAGSFFSETSGSDWNSGQNTKGNSDDSHLQSSTTSSNSSSSQSLREDYHLSDINSNSLSEAYNKLDETINVKFKYFEEFWKDPLNSKNIKGLLIDINNREQIIIQDIARYKELELSKPSPEIPGMDLTKRPPFNK